MKIMRIYSLLLSLLFTSSYVSAAASRTVEGKEKSFNSGSSFNALHDSTSFLKNNFSKVLHNSPGFLVNIAACSLTALASTAVYKSNGSAVAHLITPGLLSLIALRSGYKGQVFYEKAAQMKEMVTHVPGKNRGVNSLTQVNMFRHPFDAEKSLSSGVELIEAYKAAHNKSEFSSKIWSQLYFDNSNYNIQNVTDIIAQAKEYIEHELDYLKNYTDFEAYVTCQLNDSLRTSNVLLDILNETIDAWVTLKKETSWFGKTYSLRAVPAKWFGLSEIFGFKGTWFVKTSFSYNGATAYCAELLKQYARVLAIAEICKTTAFSSQVTHIKSA